jgi:hypothetical protein
MTVWLHCCGHVVRQNIMVSGVHGIAKLFTPWWPGKGVRDKESSHNIPYNDPIPPRRLHLPAVLQDNGTLRLIH